MFTEKKWQEVVGKYFSMDLSGKQRLLLAMSSPLLPSGCGLGWGLERKRNFRRLIEWALERLMGLELSQAPLVLGG